MRKLHHAHSADEPHFAVCPRCHTQCPACPSDSELKLRARQEWRAVMDSKQWAQKVLAAKRWADDEQQNRDAMLRRHKEERAAMKVHYDKAHAALERAQTGFRDALIAEFGPSDAELEAKAQAAGVDPVAYAGEYRAASAAYSQIG